MSKLENERSLFLSVMNNVLAISGLALSIIGFAASFQSLTFISDVLEIGGVMLLCISIVYGYIASKRFMRYIPKGDINEKIHIYTMYMYLIISLGISLFVLSQTFLRKFLQNPFN